MQNLEILTIAVQRKSRTTGALETLTTRYIASITQTAESQAHKTVRLTQPDTGAVYDVTATEHGIICDCPDFTYVKDGTERTCKHCQAAIEAQWFD